MKCHKCKGTGWILYQKEAPSPPYKQGNYLEYGARCDCLDETETNRPGKS
jgi:hypothetical protein